MFACSISLERETGLYKSNVEVEDSVKAVPVGLRSSGCSFECLPLWRRLDHKRYQELHQEMPSSNEKQKKLPLPETFIVTAHGDPRHGHYYVHAREDLGIAGSVLLQSRTGD